VVSMLSKNNFTTNDDFVLYRKLFVFDFSHRHVSDKIPRRVYIMISPANDNRLDTSKR